MPDFFDVSQEPDSLKFFTNQEVTYGTGVIFNFY